MDDGLGKPGSTSITGEDDDGAAKIHERVKVSDDDIDDAPIDKKSLHDIDDGNSAEVTAKQTKVETPPSPPCPNPLVTPY